ncbi:MAG: HAD hydrolase family protein [Clostridia bacterium]|nr:HAD hydrolase family protein [Clostridia bacterium]
MNRLPCLAAIVDFDRTLLRTDKSISAYTVRILRSWQESGGRLFAATARPERAIGEYCRQIAFDAICTLNGARTITKDSVIENPISEKSALSVLEQFSGIPGIVLSVEAENGIYANMDIPPWSPKVTDRLLDLPRAETIYKILASHPELPVEHLAVNLPDDTYYSVAERKLLQVMSRSATKWNGVRNMLDAFGIDPAHTVFFGDDNDDIEPIRRCGCGVAVRNALGNVLEAADEVTESNDEDGVARFLDRLMHM